MAGRYQPNLLRGWLVRSETGLITEFLNALGIAHDKGVVEEFPPTIDGAKLATAVDVVLARHPREKVILYLNVLKASSGVNWPQLGELLDHDPRLQLS